MNAHKTMSGRWCAPAAAGVLALWSSARADLLSADAQQFAVLGQFSNNQTNFNNGTINGNVGMGSPRQFTISNASLFGDVRFSGAASTSGFLGGPPPNNISGGGSFTGSILANDPVVTSAINYTNLLGQTLGGEAGTAISVTTGGSLNASAGALVQGVVVSGNALGDHRVFTVGSVNFPNGVFTINGSATDQVVLNVAANANFHGALVLAGGITIDHVLVNMFGGNYTTHTGGPTLDVNTNGLTTSAVWLDPNGAMSAVHTTINGRFFGGDVQNQQIVSGANINVPAPATLPLALAALAGLGRSRRRPSCA
jgi:uncharacterized protein (TIGR03382 family)